MRRALAFYQEQIALGKLWLDGGEVDRLQEFGIEATRSPWQSHVAAKRHTSPQEAGARNNQPGRHSPNASPRRAPAARTRGRCKCARSPRCAPRGPGRAGASIDTPHGCRCVRWRVRGRAGPPPADWWSASGWRRRTRGWGPRDRGAWPARIRSRPGHRASLRNRPCRDSSGRGSCWGRGRRRS